ncbi:hypothetical protein Tco_0926272 [Tanacetum coccineum]|uniref:Uncharacterized protein n=1 Tax=Tanacetum coccineum TaxID=301880 RepID=A0ABQ5DBA5_9ASTR
MGYVTNSESLTFFKGHFSPQWKFFIHTILHCLSSKKTAWDQFSSNIATSLICLATSRRFNFSKFIFEAMVKNLESPHKFLLYPRATTVTLKDSNPKPSLSHTTHSSATSPKPIDLAIRDTEETASMPHDSPLHDVHSHGSAEGSQTKSLYCTALTKISTLSKEIGVQPEVWKGMDKAKIVLSDDERLQRILPTGEERDSTEIIEEMEVVRKVRWSISMQSPKVTKGSTSFAKKIDERLIWKSWECKRQLDQRQEVPTQPTQSQGIDWNDLSVLRYHALKNKPMSIAQARRNMITYLKNQGGYKEIYFKRMSYNDIRPIFERVVMERFQDNTPEGYNLMLWGDLKILVDPEQDDDIWKNQNQWKIISWKLYETCGVHTLMVDEHVVISVIDDEETLILEEESRSKMLDKQNDPISIKQKINISPIDYSKLNKIKEDFGKRFVTQKELSAEQAFWLKHSNYNPDTSVKSHTPVRIEAPSELPKVSLVNESLKKLKHQLASFDKVVKKRTTSDAITADKIIEVQTVFNQMEAIVDQCSETDIQEKDENKAKNGKTEHENEKSVKRSQSQSQSQDLNAQLQEKVFAITALKNELRKLKGENVVNTAGCSEVYIEKTIQYTDTLRGFVESARTQNPSKPLLEFACMNTKHVQELLVYVSQTCPSSPTPSGKTDSLKTNDSNKTLLTSTGVKPSTSASRSKPSGNTKNNSITRPPRSNQKNKVEHHTRTVKSSLNKTNFVSEPISNALVKHSVRNAKFESMCAICNNCLFDANHDMCLIDHVNDVNVRLKSKSKRNKKRKLGNLWVKCSLI